MIADKVEQAAKFAQKASITAGNIGVAVAKNDNLRAMTTAANAADDALGEIPVVGGALKESLKAATTLVNAFAAVTTAFVDRGRELSIYSSRLSQATANADVNRVMADINEADRLGEKLATLIDKESEMENVFREIMLPIKEVVVDALISFIDFSKSAIITALEMMRQLPGVNREWADDLIGKLRGLKNEGELNAMMTGWLNAAAGLNITPVAAPTASGTPLGVPILS